MENLPTELFLVRILRPARTKKEILFRFHRVPFHPLPPPSTAVLPLRILSFLFSLIESSNFRLHSPSACLLCQPVRIQRTLCRNLGTRTRRRVRGARRRSEKRSETSGEEGGEKIKNHGRNAEPSYSYRDREKSSSRKDERLALLPSGRNLGVICPLEKWLRPNANEICTVAAMSLADTIGAIAGVDAERISLVV